MTLFFYGTFLGIFSSVEGKHRLLSTVYEWPNLKFEYVTAINFTEASDIEAKILIISHPFITDVEVQYFKSKFISILFHPETYVKTAHI